MTIPPLVRVALAAVLGTILIGSLAPSLDPDFWWHLRSGALILETRSVPDADPFSFTFAGKPWANHEWLAQVMLFALVRAGGLWAPLIFTAILITAANALVFARMHRRGIAPLLAVVVLAFAFYAGSLSWGPRVQMTTLFLAAVFAYALDRRTRAWLIAMPLLMIVWTNLHGGFVVGLAMMAMAVVGEWIETREFPGALAISFVAALVAGAINPNGVLQYAYPFKFLVPNPFTQLITESASPDFHRPAMLAFEVLLLGGLAAAMLAFKRLRATDVLMLVAFTHLALSQSRNVALWAIVAAPIVGELMQPLTRLLRSHPLPLAGEGRRAASGEGLIPAVLAIVVVIALPLSFLRSFHPDAPAAAEAAKYPAAAVAYMNAHRLPPNVYAGYEWGGYVIWKLWPRYRVFIDPRADTVYDAAILREYYASYNGSPEWRAIFANRRVTTALVPRRSFIAAELFAARNEWRLVYHDAQSAIFVRGGHL